MKKLLLFLPLGLLILALNSCLGDEPGDNKDWRKRNEAYISQAEAQALPSGAKVFTRIVSPWDPSGYVLMQWHNDRALTQNQLKPFSTSTCDVKYRLRNIDGLGLDSSYNITSPADSIFRSVVNTNIQGWQLALQSMHVGDSCTVVIPYTQGYGVNGKGSVLPYSTLIFDLKLVGIPAYERPL